MQTSRPPSLLLLVVVLAMGAAACSTPEARKQKHVKSGDAYVASRKYDEAIIEYRLALQPDPKSGEAQYKLADALAAADNLPVALQAYVRASDLLPDNVDVQVKTGTLLLVARRYEEAKTRARLVLQQHPDSVPGLILMGNALAGLQ